ncbi:Fibroblast growth factor receptor 1 [Stylophora pistillata]|uniref:receptor protein-tyrosine kinase n=2 Tax=Stylophora pistillata TaxID=50429 RepID=A0A2B4RGR4_STYPI|nr:Fibroblast growth factor receptor 1 [Stylophora pistillata]
MMKWQNVGVLKRSSLKDFRFLYQLYLDNNNIRSMEAGSFYHQQNLTRLWLPDNKLVNITRETFEGLKNLEELRLDHNRLRRISRGTFHYTPLLRKLDLRNNTISMLEEGAFDGLDHLEELLLSFNSLTTINKDDFGNLMSLKTLKLDSNRIRTIDGNVFDCAPLISTLELSGNKLDRIPIKTIGNLKFLEFLQINNNPIKLIEADTFNGLQRLTKIDLSHCNISSIQNGSFDDLEHLRTVYLRNNFLNCNCHLKWLPTWLSKRPELTFIGAICHEPNEISGIGLTSANLTSFVCSCAACKMDANCSGKPVNCSCADKWAGSSCSDTCRLNSEAVNSCQRFGGKCICGRNTTINPLSKVTCSFNITTAKCSEDGELKKIGSRLECKCKKGFKGNGIHCIDINECNTGAASCLPHSDCINTPGSHYCKCHRGFTEEFPGPIALCKDVDECLRQKRCHFNATCYNSPGSYTCKCRPGFVGDGVSCLPEPEKPKHLIITVISPTEVSVSWTSVDISKTMLFKVEYKRFGIDGADWEVVSLQPNETKATLRGLTPYANYLVRVGAFSFFNTTIYSEKKLFTPGVHPTKDLSSEGGFQDSVVIVVALVVSLVVLIVIALLLVCLTRRKERPKRRSNPQYVPGLEDLIEMRTRTHSGGADPRGNRDRLELGSNLHSFASGAVDQTDEWEIARDRLQIGQKIGEGQFGLVLEGTLTTDDGPVKVAVKTIKEHADRFDYKDLLLEMEMMKEIGQHSHVVSLIGTCTTPGPLYIITEYVSGGNLLDYLRSSRPADETYVNIISTLSSRDLLKIALDCARGMGHIALKKFVHRDLAARNVLLTAEHEAKVADFGLARDVYGDGQYVKTGGGRVPIKWMAPESIQDQIYTTRSDVWSFGVLLWEIVTIGASPYPCVPVNLLLTKLLCGYRMSKPAHCSDELYGLMKTCWHLDPEKRPTFSEICVTLSEMLSESARSYVNITISEERMGSGVELSEDASEQTTSV